jgi:hypothetical protein
VRNIVAGMLPIVAALSLGCTDVGKGELDGEFLFVDECVNGTDATFAPFSLNLDFFALEQLGSASFIRMQHGGQPLHRTDALVVYVDDAIYVQHRLGQPIPVDNPQVRITLHVMGSCPDTTQSMSAHKGYITFDKFGMTAGAKVKTRFHFDLIDDRTGELVGYNFSGKADFEVRVGQPYTHFSSTY